MLRAGEKKALEPEVASSLEARIGWLVRNGRPEALAAVRSLAAGPAEGHREAALHLYKLGVKVDKKLARSMLTHEDWRVQALAGAFLMKHGDEDTIDYVIRGLNDEVATEEAQVIFDALGKSKLPAAKAAITKFLPKATDVRAFRMLALFHHLSLIHI